MGHESILLNRNYLGRATERPNQFLACFRSIDRKLSLTDTVFTILVENKLETVASHRTRFLIGS